ncbi:hypothetical protein BGX28_001078 [Mortierella sp. GBA30]|nr:hypothetical protein BGX28_001078 [Mortierella sp. GBA30]
MDATSTDGDRQDDTSTPLFLGLDLSTQQLKVVALEQIFDSNDGHSIRAHSSFAVHFDSELPYYNTQGGVTVQRNGSTIADQNDRGVVTTPVLMWVEALERVFDKMKERGFPFQRVEAISGAAQQHGSVYWSNEAQQAFNKLQSSTDQALASIFKDAFTIYQSPIWQDTSTTSQCQELEEYLGRLDEDDSRAMDESSIRLRGTRRLAERTGSRAYERYTGSQILKIIQKKPEVYAATERISLVSSFLASLLMAKYASIDAADGSGMNLLDIKSRTWDSELTAFVSQGGSNPGCSQDLSTNTINTLVEKLGEIDASGRKVQGILSNWFVERYGFHSDVNVVSFTGDNPATAMAMQAEPGDAIVSLGTSDTLLLYTDSHGTMTDTNNNDVSQSSASLSVGYLCHPVDSSGYLMLYCAKNGSLAREKVRDLYTERDWDLFSKYLQDGMRFVRPQTNGGSSTSCGDCIGFYFFDREIWPPVHGVRRFQGGEPVDDFIRAQGCSEEQDQKRMNVLAICESQFLAMRIRSSQSGARATCSSSVSQLSPPGISRILATGGASSNQTILQLLSNVFGVPVICMNNDDQQMGAGSAAWGAARKAFLYGGHHSRSDRDDQTRGQLSNDAGEDTERRPENTDAIIPDLEKTREYVQRIPEFIRLERLLL